MEGGIDADAPLDYVAFQIFPTQNRYETLVCGDSKIENLASGLLEQLKLHLPGVKELLSKGLNDNFKLQLPANLKGSAWFTKSTLARFLNFVDAADKLKIVSAIEDETSQLEEARRFHLSLYTPGHHDHFGSGGTDDRNLNDTEPTRKPEVQNAIPDANATKNELLRAMDLRLTALREELAAAFNQVAGSTCSTKEIVDLATFSQHFGAIDLRNLLCKYLALSQRNQAADPQNEKSMFAYDSMIDSGKMTNGAPQVSTPVNTVKPVKYGVSPAKVAQVERQSSTESEETSSPSDEDRSSAERGRPLIRPASPRRSASPMRRIQIGKSGSRRATALTIKSLSYFPTRERVSSNIDAATNSSEDEKSIPPQKKPENNVRRMSVQDAISLFESKQKDQNTDLQKRSLADISVNTNKSVLRRWSAGMGDSSTQCPPENACEGVVQMTPNNLAVGDIPNNLVELKSESDFTYGGPNPVDTTEVGAKLETREKRASHPTESIVAHGEETHGKVTASVEWNRKKEAELDQMRMKMMETKPVRFRNMTGNSRSQLSSEQRGGFYDHYKEKRDEKLRGENASKRAEKETQFKVLEEILDQRKAEMASKNVGIVGKKDPQGRPRKSQKNLSPSAKPKKETSKPTVAKKASPIASPLPPTRKSWPSAPSSRTTRISPAKIPNEISSTGTTPTRRKPQPTPSPSPTRPRPKVERSQQQQKIVKGTQADSKRSLKGPEEKQQQAFTESGKTTKTKVLPATGGNSGGNSATIPAKPSFRSKVTRKSTVVPLETKPFLRKGSGIALGVGPFVGKTEASPQAEESMINSGNLIQAQENDVVAGTSKQVSQPQEGDLVPLVSDDADLEPEASVNSHQKCENTENSDQFVAEGYESFKKTAESPIEIQADEESVISSIAWVEIEDCQKMLVSCDNGPPQTAIPAIVAPVALSSPRVRHSLSQMLQEDSGEPEIIEWGNAENPPAMVYQKDAPKGLKRLLKFARKSRGEANASGWSSPSVFSEGEEDAEEPKAASKRNADALLKKATLQAKDFGQQKASFGESYDRRNWAAHEILSAQSTISKFPAQSSHNLGHLSAAPTTTKATKSFFSLSTFRSSKSNETKLR